MKQNLIVPKQWIKDIKKHKEKFYNNSVNSTQVHTCFYTNNPNAFRDGNFPANFDLPARINLDGDGVFEVKIKAYKGKSATRMFYNIFKFFYNGFQ